MVEHIVEEFGRYAAAFFEVLGLVALFNMSLSSKKKKRSHQRVYGMYLFTHYRKLFGRSIMLSLEFLVAADIISTVLSVQTLESVIILLIVVVIRIILTLSLYVELEGRWPWSPHTEEVDDDDDEVKPASLGVSNTHHQMHTSGSSAPLDPVGSAVSV